MSLQTTGLSVRVARGRCLPYSRSLGLASSLLGGVNYTHHHHWSLGSKVTATVCPPPACLFLLLLLLLLLY